MKDTIEIEIGIKTANQLIREHWRNRKRSKGIWKMFIRKAMRHQKLKDATKGQKFKLKIIHVRPAKKQIRDYDNLIFGFKVGMDALTEEGFIWDDSMAFIGIPKHAQIVGPEMKTIITREYE